MNLYKEELWNGFLFSSDKRKLDRNYIHQFISTKSYWAREIPRSIVDQSIMNSITFGVYENEKQVGFARMITDLATFGYLADVFIDEAYRNQGLSKHLMEFIFSIKEFENLRRIMLGTKDAHELYKKYNFKPLASPERFMEIARPDIYKKLNSSSEI